MFAQTLILPEKMSFPDKTAILFDDCKGKIASLTYDQLKETVSDVANELIESGVRKGERVIFISENHLNWLPIFLGIANAGAVAVPLDGNVAVERFHSIVEDCKPAAIIISRLFEARFTEFMLKDRKSVKMLDFHFDLIKLGKSLVADDDSEIEPDDVAAIIYTSGTTGTPKGIMLSHGAFFASVEHGRFISNYSSEDIMLNLLPFTHVFALVDAGLVQLYTNSTLILSNSFNPAEILQLIMKHKTSYIVAVPRLAELMAAGIQQTGISLPPIKMIIGGAACRADIISMLRSAGLKPIQGYGMTETSAGVLMCVDGPIESVGKPVGEVQVKLGKIENGVGELMVKSPTLLTGVFGQKDLTKKLFDGDWFHTGDLASIDGDGYVTIRGRAKEVIISSSGLNVYPDELELRLGLLPFAEEFSVFGMKEGDLEYPALAYMVKNEFFKDKSIGKVKDFVEEEVRKKTENWPDPEKIKKIFMFDTPMPRSANGKIKRYALVESLTGQKTEVERPKDEVVMDSGKLEALFEEFRNEAASFLNVEPKNIDKDTRFDSFVQLDSLGIIAMLIKLERKFNVSFKDLMGQPVESFYDLFKFLAEKVQANENSVEKKVASTGPTVLQLPTLLDFSEAAIAKRQEFLKNVSQDEKLGFPRPENPVNYNGNIEGFFGFSEIPLGVIGPLKVLGEHANGDFFVPLATTEGALVSSVARGCQIISMAGGAEVRIVCDSVVRTPIFIFKDLDSMISFGHWIEDNFDKIKASADSTTRHGKLEDIEQFPIGSKMILRFSYSTGDASGQNMTTIATRKAVDFILNNFTGEFEDWFLESNLSGDKKINGLNFTRNRGKKVIAQILIPGEIIKNHLHTTSERMRKLAELSMLTSLQAHAFGVQAHFANVLAAVYIAAGQDPACVAESAAGITHLEEKDGDLSISITLPGIMVGTVGGGTRLPTQNNCLKIMNCAGAGNSSKFAEILAATVLGGEISLIGAMAADEFTDAHAKYGRTGGIEHKG